MMVCNYCKEKDIFVEIFLIKNKNNINIKGIKINNIEYFIF